MASSLMGIILYPRLIHPCPNYIPFVQVFWRYPESSQMSMGAKDVKGVKRYRILPTPRSFGDKTGILGALLHCSSDIGGLKRNGCH